MHKTFFSRKEPKTSNLNSVQTKVNKKCGLNIFYWNLQSLLNKIDIISVLLNQYDVDILCVVEHWLSADELCLIKFSGYVLVDYFCRPKNGMHGGSAIYAKNTLKAVKVECSEFSALFTFEICSIYRERQHNFLFSNARH